jgi:S1-C subfamily serine protease
VWLDDDGDEPIGGEIPDPSTRQWRHPSEIAAEAAKAAAAAPLVPEAAMLGAERTPVSVGSSASILWPITVVGGCIAVAALGVFGLYLTGAASNTEIQVTSATTINPGGAGLSSLARQAATPESRILAEDLATSNEFAPDEDAPLRSLDAERVPLPTTTTTSLATSTTSEAPVPSSTLGTAPPARRVTAPVGPAVYPVGGPDGGFLASVVLVDGYLITSASAVAGHDEVRVQVGLVEATAVVSHVDALTDIAILNSDDPLIRVAIPEAVVGPEVAPGVPVYLGYCAKDIRAEPIDNAWRESGDESAPTPAIQPGCSPSPTASALQQEFAALDAQSGQLDETEPSVPKAEEQPTSTTSTTAAAAVPAKPERRAGKVYSLDQTLRTTTNRLVYYPIRTGIHQDDKVAGSPLRNAEGQLVGLVVASNLPNISALPINRVLAVAQSLTTTGLGSPAWLGIEVRSTPAGVEVLSVTEGGPSDDLLEVGDIIDRAAGKSLNEADHLEYLTRTAGPGEQLQVRITRNGEWSWARITVGTAPVN